MYIPSQTFALGESPLQNDFLGSIWGFQDISIFTYVNYNHNHEIRKSTFFWLVPFGDVIFLLLAAEAGPSGVSSSETFTTWKILVGFSWKKAKTWRHDILRKLGILAEILTLNSDFNFCSNKFFSVHCTSGTFLVRHVIVPCLGYSKCSKDISI